MKSLKHILLFCCCLMILPFLSVTNANAACTWQNVGQHVGSPGLWAAVADMNCGSVNPEACPWCSWFPAMNSCSEGASCDGVPHPVCLTNPTTCTMDSGSTAYVQDMYSCVCSACVADPTQTRTSTPCPSGQSGTITEERTSSCPSATGSPVWGAWTQTANTCAANCVPEATQTTTNPCPSGQSGSGINYQRTSSCPSATGSPVWSGWVETSRSCAANCVPEATQTTTNPCPSGQSGSGINYQRTSSCPAATGSPVWGGWVETSRSCAANCVPEATQTTTNPCPSGQSGSGINYQRTSSCPSATGSPVWSGWVETSRSCAPNCVPEAAQTTTNPCPSGESGSGINYQRTSSCPSATGSPVWSGWVETSRSCAPNCVPEAAQTQTISCSPGFSGAINQSRTSSCPSATGSPVWSMWTITSDTCAANCVPEAAQTQTLSCASGFSGAINQSRTSSCPSTTGSPVWSGWSTTSDTCAANCVPEATQTRTSTPCPMGETGVINEQRTSSCPSITGSPVWSSWAETSRTCSPTCTPQTATRTSTPCPVGQSGVITEEQNLSCPSATWSAWTTTSSTCTANCSPDPTQTRTSTPCPMGESGTINEQRTSSCPTTTGSPVWSSWVETSRTCSATCTTSTDTRTSTPCPMGQSGTITEQRNFTCPAATWSAWTTTTNTCTAIPVNGSCGSSDGGTFGNSTPPSSNFCSAGSATAVTTGATTYTWSCNGSGGGSNAPCTATRSAAIVNGSCGSSDGGTFGNSTPPSSNFCSAGSATAVTTGATTYTWSCNGSGGGTNSSCTATRAAGAVNGSCGSSDGGTFGNSTPPSSNLCGDGSTPPVNIVMSIFYAWVCPGSGGGSNAACNATRAAAIVNGSCGSSNGGTFPNATPPSSNFCSAGSATAVTTGATTYTWSCNGSGGGTNAPCTSTRSAAAVNGSCGTSNGGTFPNATPPSTNFCGTGSATAVTTGATTYTWSCNGSGGGTNSACTATRAAPIITGSCGGTANTCGGGTPSGYVAGSCNGNQTWSCNGSGGGANVSCSLANPPCPIPGQCGSANGNILTSAPSSNLCSVGSASGVSGSGPWSWSCAGQFGGADASCSASRLTCGSSAATYTFPATPCSPAGATHTNTTGPLATKTPTSFTWNCFGTAGANISCSAPRMVDGICGWANGQNMTAAPLAPDLCQLNFTPNPTIPTGVGPWSWTCSSLNGGIAPTCTANPIINGTCGTAHGIPTSVAPSLGRCATGTPTAVTGTGPFSWGCNGTGPGSMNITCSAPPPPPPPSFGGACPL